MLEFLREFWAYVVTRKKLWILPLAVALALIGALLVVTQGTPLMPFIYTLF